MKLTKKEEEARKRLCLPLDRIFTVNDLKSLVRELSPIARLFKIGKETYTRFGCESVKIVQSYGADVFLDLKYHDIPNTVKGAADVAAQLGVYMFDVHASGGLEMMQAAVEGAKRGAEKYGVESPKIVAVSVLTSIDSLRYVQNFIPVIKSLPIQGKYKSFVDDLCNFPFSEAINAEMEIRNEKNGQRKVDLKKKFLKKYGESFDNLIKVLGLENIISKSVLNFAHMANKAGLDGIVCSGADLHAIKNKLSKDFIYVTPGIKGPRTPAGSDQKRVFTPGRAIQEGSSVLVVGRAITGHKYSEERIQIGYEVLQDMARYL